ncbi:DUF349 domain-containing protein [Plantibacter sp. ME-Dv--P-122b]|uniref:DUF349 domain-containing protein n=1 Tax=Plantibacter sp. ME-Dv--P-122b TaxID=3040300 RepID=UPI00254C87B3|nr:DUF349 domain-containing protein [Plantibacter sp. ME-Dv--P-122b]
MRVTSPEIEPWGRVDDDGTVYVREADGERAVGQYPDGSKEEALAYFERKFTDLAGQVTLLEQRAKRGAPATDVAKAVKSITKQVESANAVGNLQALLTRLAALDGTVSELTEAQSQETKAALEEAARARLAIVEEAEQLAQQDPARVQWKQTSARLDELFAEWQRQQHDGPRLAKNDANDLWKRFRTARATIEQHRRAFYTELDSVHKEARAIKQKLVERAEALIAKGAEGIPAYRSLLDEWKASPRAGKRQDDALWAKFKAAGDAIYGAKAEIDARDNEEFQGNLDLKLAVLADAEPILSDTNRDSARKALTDIQRRWDEIGKVPREQVRVVEDRLRKIETHVKQLEDEHWKRNNPETKARTEGLASQLADAIAKLEDEVEAARASGDADRLTAAIEALDARKAWLGAIR